MLVINLYHHPSTDVAQANSQCDSSQFDRIPMNQIASLVCTMWRNTSASHPRLSEVRKIIGLLWEKALQYVYDVYDRASSFCYDAHVLNPKPADMKVF